ATGRPWDYDAPRYRRVAQARQHEQNRMLAYTTSTGCRLEFLRRELDDAHARECGRCDNCTGTRPDTTIGPAAHQAAQTALRRPGVEFAPRRMWPTGLAATGVDRSGKIPPEWRAEPGRALARMSDIGWGAALRALFDTDTDTPVPGDMFDAVVQVLASWQWDRRPSAVVSLGSRTRPRLVNGLAGSLASLGKMDYLGALRRTGSHTSRNPSGTNSAQRLRQVCDGFTADFDIPSTAVLLVDDLRDSGWSLTEAAMTLRRAGAEAVYPLALALDA
ncbi:MAG: RecQ family zinc-binding domain-containing protein, partial [Stackebrandtia sp.]